MFPINSFDTIKHTNRMVGSWTDWDLSELGIKQVNNIGRNLSRELENKKYVMYYLNIMKKIPNI
ncbi:TPA: hypothetical protein I9080_001142 [Clostridium perfringens]|uniref:Uncharacterized protein n=1 Tax=Clostridium perfringens TaxID=1502 RepID=A0A8H9QY85_CLOPF|nr:hypothetical protein [Clostridium perfringens]HAT4307362.1 hypothetical protein [Clostridium perfringens]